MKTEKTDNELIEAFWISQGGKMHMLADVHYYESDWNMLMPVVEKIDSLHNSKFNYDPEKIAKGDWPKDDEYIDVIALPMNTSISETYKAVVKFIKWLNETVERETR